MRPTLAARDIVWLDARDRLPELGAIVAVSVPGYGELVKRVAGLPGDELEVRGGAVVRNGQPVGLLPQGQVPDWDGKGEVLGLDRLFAQRFAESLGAVHTIQLHTGGPGARPLHVPPGFVYLLGDNRDDSIDSRAFGPVPESTIEGRVEYLVAGFGSLPAPWRTRVLARIP